MLKNHSFRTVIFLLVLLLLLFSCSDNEDKRKSVVKDYGEPDKIITSSFGTYKNELYIYARSDINRAYEFQKSASGCGGSGQWYVNRVFYTQDLPYYYGIDVVLYAPPQIKYTPIQSASPGEKLPVIAEVTDSDNLVVQVDLYYRTSGHEAFNKVTMLVNENKYSTNIQGESVTTDGIDYYIELSYYVEFYDKTQILQMPENKGYYTISISENVEKRIEGPTETTSKFISPSSLPVTGDMFNDLSPVGP